MSFLDILTGRILVTRRKAIAPRVTDSTHSALIPQDDNSNAFIAGHENYNDYLDYPDILGPMNTSAAFHDTARVHAPFTQNRNNESYTTGGGKVFFDSDNPDIQRIPRSELQVMFDQKKEIPIPPALVPATGVEVPVRNYNYGWRQHSGIEYDILYGVSVQHAPSPQLSRGINVLQQALPNDIHRASMKTRAPKPKRSIS